MATVVKWCTAAESRASIQLDKFNKQGAAEAGSQAGTGTGTGGWHGARGVKLELQGGDGDELMSIYSTCHLGHLSTAHSPQATGHLRPELRP